MINGNEKSRAKSIAFIRKIWTVVAFASLSLVPACKHIGSTLETDKRIVGVSEEPAQIDPRSLLPQQDPSNYWRLRSQMTTGDVAAKFDRKEWEVGTRLSEMTPQLSCVPLGTLDTMVFALSDGTLTCTLDENRLRSWLVRKAGPEPSVDHCDAPESADRHRNAYFRVQSSEPQTDFLDVPLDAIPAAIRRAERATYSELVDDYIKNERDLLIHGSFDRFYRRPLKSIKDPKERGIVLARHNAWANALRALAKRLDDHGIQPPSYLKPLVIEKMPYAYVKLYIPLCQIEEMEKTERDAPVSGNKSIRSETNSKSFGTAEKISK